VSKAFQHLSNPRVFVVPFFVSQGHFTEELIPQVLGFKPEGQRSFSRVRSSGEQTFFYCEPVGTHPRMTEVILSRARSVVEAHPFPEKPAEGEISLFIAGHGTGRHRNSRKSAENQADLIREQAGYADVHVVFMEESPRIADWHELARTRYVVVVPFFLSDGLHAAEDIPVLLGEPEPIVRKRLANGQPPWQNPTEKHGKLVWYASAIGTDPAIVEVIQDRVNEAAQWGDRSI